MNVGYPILGDAAIPGDTEGLDGIAKRLRAARSDVTHVQDRVAANGLQDWTGEAADRFRSSLERLPGELGNAAGAFDDAATGISRFAGELTGFQERAGDYAMRIREHEEAANAAQQRHDEAQTKVDAARQQQSEATDPVSLKAAGDALDLGLSLWRQALSDLEEHRGEIESLRRQAYENREQYDRAARVCCTTLGRAQEAIGNVAFPG